MFYDSSFSTVDSCKDPNPLSTLDFDGKRRLSATNSLVTFLSLFLVRFAFVWFTKGVLVSNLGNRKTIQKPLDVVNNAMLSNFLSQSWTQIELIDLTFNSNFICPCGYSCICISIQNYQLLERLQLCKLNFSRGRLCDNDIDC